MRALWGLILGLMLIAVAPAQDVTRDLVRTVLEDADCQTSLPGDDGAIRSGDGPAEEVLRNRRRGSPFDGVSSLGGGFTTVLMWLLVVVVAVILIASLVRHKSNVAPRKRSPAKPVTLVTEDKPEDAPLPAYARLAADGDFAGAVHAALLHAFAMCATRIGALPEHATGRQVLRLAKRKKLPTGDLGELVMAVERVHFGGEVADRELYEASQQRLRAWEAACQPPA